MVAGRCQCGDSFCASFCTQPKPQGASGPDHHCIDLDAAEGMLILDIVVGKIAHVEVLHRDDVREKLGAVLPGEWIVPAPRVSSKAKEESPWRLTLQPSESR